MKPEQAEIVALRALEWLAGEDDLLPVFLGASGASEDDLRARAGDADFLIAVLDFITMDDAWVRSFCDKERLAYDLPLRARHALPGGEAVHWT
ncbi:DUF3572 domain-containing protein [Anianabacter salinae]|uniref:DUF3572 domain-containing protein n=1 Tax=Anianabacter salinae TaxID=2851023 RepID=UPI00225E0FB5|nr:DUF3572 domain-containing protein [Anianabacter salinae]MBV0911393.1 DUF3572 domain-containing protein [Anianabacter salinae]